MRYILAFLLSTFLVASPMAGELRLDREAFVQRAMAVDPRVREERMGKDTKELRIDEIKSGALLPKFEVSTLVGPAPGLKTRVVDGDTIDTWDFTKMGPFFGVEVNIAQPLNYGQLETGLKAARADLHQKELEIDNNELKKAVELQEYYYGYLLAQELDRLVQDAYKQLVKARDKMEEDLENEEDGVSQNDLLEMKAGFFEVEKNLADVKAGLRKARLASRFALALDDTTQFRPTETSLVAREDEVPSLDSLKQVALAVNPELRRLQMGLTAMDLQMELAAAKMGPEFFVMGKFSYAKSWAGDRKAINPDAFSQDPVNQISGAFGVGMRYRLNFWNAWEGYRKSRAEYRLLKQKESYAPQGILSKVEEKYVDFESARDKLASARRSMSATEGLLKGAALQYEIDPSKTDALVAAYKRNLYMQKDYYYAVYQYNLAIANLFAQVGLPSEGPLANSLKSTHR